MWVPAVNNVIIFHAIKTKKSDVGIKHEGVILLANVLHCTLTAFPFLSLIFLVVFLEIHF